MRTTTSAGSQYRGGLRAGFVPLLEGRDELDLPACLNYYVLALGPDLIFQPQLEYDLFPGVGQTSGRNPRGRPVCLPPSDNTSRSGRAGRRLQCQAAPIKTRLAPDLFRRCRGPFFKQAREGEQRIRRQPSQECRFVGLADNQRVRCRVRHVIKPLQQQTLLEISKPRGVPAVHAGFRFNRLHITECPNAGMAAWRLCDEKVKFSRRRKVG